MTPLDFSLFPAPTADIPEPVRAAYDALPDAIALLDLSGRIRFANRAFCQLKPDMAEDLTEKFLAEQSWLAAAAEPQPWMDAIAANTSVTGRQFSIHYPDQATRQFILNAAPVQDETGNSIGCLISLHEVSGMHSEIEHLRAELEELKSARSKVELQYQELLRFATRDPLTGCYNRRAFFSIAEPLFAKLSEEKRPLCCIMADIDRFKLVNDNYGHSVGDQALLAVARLLTSCLRVNDLLCRYGGEEFCILLPNASSEEAMEVAERLRTEIERKAGRRVRSMQDLHLTMSFGVASLTPELANLNELIELSDYALYVSKRNGRNRATLWTEDLSAEPTDPA